MRGRNRRASRQRYLNEAGASQAKENDVRNMFENGMEKPEQRTKKESTLKLVSTPALKLM